MKALFFGRDKDGKKLEEIYEGRILEVNGKQLNTILLFLCILYLSSRVSLYQLNVQKGYIIQSRILIKSSKSSKMGIGFQVLHSLA